MSSDPLVPRLRIVGLSKSFGEVQALSAVSLDVVDGEVHAILGENGAGKSTLMNLIHGALLPDSGQILISGQEVRFASPLDARRNRIGMVHQHFMLVPNFTVAENLALAELEQLKGGAEIHKRAARAQKIATDLGWDLPLESRTGDLPVGAQQRIEILKALAGNAEILILDEPTAVLGKDEVEDLFRVLRELKAQGVCVLLIAHKLSEIMAIADRVTVLRNGQWIASRPLADTNQEEIAHWMAGTVPLTPKRGEVSGEAELLVAHDITVLGDRGEVAVRELDFSIRGGEVLGFGGVDGNGQVELAEALAGVRPLTSGRVDGTDRVGYISQDRQADGLALGMTIQDNLLVGALRRETLFVFGWLRVKAIRDWAHGLIDKFRIRIGRLGDPVSSLSGGNQQKIIVSRTLDQKPAVIVAVNPTRGLDFGATQFVHEQILDAAGNGCAVALFTTDREELAALSHRIVTMSRGELV